MAEKVCLLTIISTAEEERRGREEGEEEDREREY
jgi:hypothetical protein